MAKEPSQSASDQLTGTGSQAEQPTTDADSYNAIGSFLRSLFIRFQNSLAGTWLWLKSRYASICGSQAGAIRTSSSSQASSPLQTVPAADADGHALTGQPSWSPCSGCALGKHNFLIHVEGGIGTGKTEVLEYLQARHGEGDKIQVIQEDIDSRNVHLSTLYDAMKLDRDPSANVSENVTDLLEEGEAKIFEDRMKVMKNENVTVISEHSLRASSDVFGAELVARGLLGDGHGRGQLAWQRKAYEALKAAEYYQPDVVIYLWKNIDETKGSDLEDEHIPKDYQKALQKRYDDIYCPEGTLLNSVIRIDTTDKSAAKLAAEVETALQQKLEEVLKSKASDEKKVESHEAAKGGA